MLNTNHHKTCGRHGGLPGRAGQTGMATLFISVIILILVTLVVVYAARVGMMDLRMSGNEVRYKEAFAIADGGLEYAVQQFAKSTSVQCVDETGAASTTPVSAGDPCPPGTQASGQYIYDPDKDRVADAIPNPFLSDKNISGGTASSSQPRFDATVAQTATASGVFAYTFTATGESTDRTGTAQVSQQVIIRHAIGGKLPDTPIIADGTIDIGGNMHVVPNSNGACPEGTGKTGCPASVWTHEEFGSGSSISSCHIEGFENGQCPNPSQDPLYSQITNAADEGEDIIELDPYSPTGNFPPDLFAYLFGVPYTQWGAIWAMAEEDNQVIDADTTDTDNYQDCDDLGPTSKGIIWADVDCTINGNGDIGSLENPVILVIKDSELKFSGHPTIYGIVFVFDSTPGDGTNQATVDVGGGTEIHGAMMSNVSWGGGPGTGTFAVVYDSALLNNLSSNSDDSYTGVSSVPGSWSDWQ